MKSFEYTIKDELGIHARPAGLLVKAAKGADCKIIMWKGDKAADCTRLFNIMSLGVKCGDTVTINCEGDHEQESVDLMKEFFENNL